MRKTSRYSKKDYVLSFDGDVVYLDIEVLVHRESETGPFLLEIVQSQVDCKEMAFACYLIERMTSEGLAALNTNIKVRLVEELTPSLFTLFYAGEILPDDTQIKQAS
jgi:hypothetical protein